MPPAKPLLKSLKQYFFTGLFVLIPVGLTLFMVVWLVSAVDSLLGGLFQKVFGFHIPGLGLVFTAGVIVLIGMLMSTNLLVQHIFELFEERLLHIPGVRAIYKTVKALTDAFSPANRKSYRHVVLVEYPHPGALSLGFVTSQMIYSAGGSTGEPLPRGTPASAGENYLAVYVPTNHFYLGNTVLVPSSKVSVTSLTVEEGIQIVLSGGAGFPDPLVSKGFLP